MLELRVTRAKALHQPLDLDDRNLPDTLQGNTTGVVPRESTGIREMPVKSGPIARVSGSHLGSIAPSRSTADGEEYLKPTTATKRSNTCSTLVLFQRHLRRHRVPGSHADAQGSAATHGRADILRRPMCKKDPRNGFAASARRRCKRQKIDEKQHRVFVNGNLRALLLQQSHSAAYALVSYQTLFENSLVEFMAALMTSEMGDTDKG